MTSERSDYLSHDVVSIGSSMVPETPWGGRAYWLPACAGKGSSGLRVRLLSGLGTGRASRVQCFAYRPR